MAKEVIVVSAIAGQIAVLPAVRMLLPVCTLSRILLIALVVAPLGPVTGCKTQREDATEYTAANAEPGGALFPAYPPLRRSDEDSTPGRGFAEYRNANHGLAIHFPSSMIVQEEDGADSCAIVKATTPWGPFDLPMIMLRFTYVEGGIDLAAVNAREWAKAWANLDGESETMTIRYGRGTIDGRPSIWVVDQAIDPQADQLTMLTWYVTRGECVYWVRGAITGGMRAFEQHKAQFETSARSLRFFNEGHRGLHRSPVQPGNLLDYEAAIRAESGLSSSEDQLALGRFFIKRRQDHMRHMHSLPITDPDSLLFYTTRMIDGVRRKYPLACLQILLMSDAEAHDLPPERRYELVMVLIRPEEVDLTTDYSGSPGSAPAWLSLGQSPPWTSLDHDVRRRWNLDKAILPLFQK